MKFKKIYVEITNICNKNCSFCSKDEKKKKEMTLEEFKMVIEKIKSFTDYIYLHIKGEPLSHSKFNEILNICKINNMKVNITTNGTYLNKQSNNIINNNVRQINISFNSLTNDECIEILDTIEKLVNNKIHVVCRFWALNNGKMTIENNNHLNKIIKKYNINNEQIIKLNEDNNLKIKPYLYINKHNLFTWPNDSKKINNKGSCYGLKDHIGILSDGTVVPCCLDSNGCIELGNIYKETLNDILNKSKTKQIIIGFKNNKLIENLCQKCDITAIKN